MGWVAPAVKIGGAVLGGLSGGKKKKKQATAPRAPAWADRNGRIGSDMLLEASRRSADEAIAGFTPDQNAAFQAVRDAQGFGQADMAGAQATAQRLSQGITPGDISKFYNPYESDVINASLADIERMRQRRQLGAATEAEGAKAWGGDRAAVYQGVIDGEYDRTGASTIANLRHQGFTTAGNMALQSGGLALTGNAQLQNIIQNRRSNLFDDASALYNAGAVQQGQEQRVLDYPVTAAEGLMRNAAQFYQGSVPLSGGDGGGVSGAMQGIVGGLDFGGKIYDIIKGWGKP